jgi:Flp pilus assembly protein TadD
MVFSTFWLERQLWGLDPTGYHVVNVLLHAATAVFLWRLLLRLKLPGAWLAAAAFALHPVHVESVAWIAERKNVLSGLFYMLAASAYMRFRPLENLPSRTRIGWYIVSLGLFALALLSKTTTCSLPAAILLVIWWKRGRLMLRDGLPLVPMFLLGGAFAALTTHLEQSHVGAEQIDWQLPVAQRCIIAGNALWFYLGKLLVPANLCFVYPRWTPDAAAPLDVAAPLGWLLLLAALLVMRRRFGRGPAAAMLFFSGTLVPAVGFIDVFPFKYSFVADHFQYLASIGPLVLLAAAFHRAAGGAGASTKHAPSPLVQSACAAVLICLGGLTMARTFAFQSEESVWRDTLAKNDAAWSAHLNLGVILDQRGETQSAIAHFEKAMTIAPKESAVHVNLALAYDRTGRTDEALASYDTALSLNPKSWTAHYNRGGTLARLGRNEEAIRDFKRSAELSPEPASSHYNCGIVLEKMGRREDALLAFQQAVESKPDWIAPRLAAIRCLRDLGRKEAATAALRDVISLFPDEPEPRAMMRQMDIQ